MKKVKVTQTRGLAGREPTQRRTALALGLGRIGKSKEFTLNPAIIGMLRKIQHVIAIEPLK